MDIQIKSIRGWRGINLKKARDSIKWLTFNKFFPDQAFFSQRENGYLFSFFQ